MAECLMCDEKLNQDGECPNGCTEEPDYGVMEDVADDIEVDDWDDDDGFINDLYDDDEEYDEDYEPDSVS